MIIKSMARKEPTFAQLYDYITREGDYDEDYCFTQNFILRDREALLNEFERNSKLLSKRKNGNYLYHEIISITRAKGISEQEQKEKLMNIVREYTQSRAKDCLVFGGLHVEKDDNLHFHLIISANELNQTKRYRLTKQQFSEAKIGLEVHVLERFPELEQDKLISANKKSDAKTNNKAQEMKRRTGKPTQKELFRDKIYPLFEHATDLEDFKSRLEKIHVEIYQRGKTIGFYDIKTDKKYRLFTLGLMAEYKAVEKGAEPKFGRKEEWLRGDFSHRAKQTKKKKWRTQRFKDKKVKPRDEQTTTENIKETAREWVMGDFDNRDARNQEAKLPKWLKQKREEEEREAEKRKATLKQEAEKRKAQMSEQRSNNASQEHEASDTTSQSNSDQSS